MRTFWIGWKRKAAFLTLVLTCSVAVLWFRSHFMFDVLDIPLGGDEYFQICSQSQNVSLSRMSITRTGDNAQGKLSLWNSGKIERLDSESRYWFHLHIDRSYGSVGQTPPEGFGVVPVGLSLYTFGATYQAKGTCRAIPYWLVVLPLTLLSAGLLILSLRSPNPSRPTRKKTEELFDGIQHQPSTSQI